MSIHDLSSLLATERSRLAILLRQVAMHGWANALPAQISGIAEARSEIARLKAELHQLGEMVVDELLDQETDEERAQAATSGRGSIHIGDTVGGDKFTGDKVMGDKIINQIVLRPLPVNLRSLVQPLIDHYAADLFGGREAELAMLDSFLADPDQPYGLLVAPTGLGKTALLIHWIARLQQHQPHWKIIFAPISIRYQTASELTILGILAHSLAEVHHDLEQFRSYDQSAQSLRALIGDYLRRPLPDGMQILLVLDAIDEATGWEVGPLCAVAPQAGLKIVISARQRADRTREDWRFHLGWDTFPVAPLDLHQLGRSAVTALLAQNTLPQANDPAFVDQFYRISEGDPLTCNLLLKALISNEIKPDSLTNRPPGLEAFLKGWVEVLRKRRKASAPIRELLALCAVAYGPLSSDDLQALAPEVFEEQGDIVDAVHDDEVARFIITVGEQQTYVFSHQRLREVFLEQIYSVKERAKLQQRLIDYGIEWYADRSVPLPDYLRQFWIAHLRAAGDWQRIRTVLTEIVPSSDGRSYSQPWQTARFAAEGSDTAYLADLDVLWRWAEAHNDLALMLRCALITSSLRSRSGNLTPELLVQLVKVGTTEGKWSPAAALEQIAHMHDAGNQAACLQALIEAGIGLPWQRTLEITRSIMHQEHRAKALAVLVDLLPPKEQAAILAEALQAIRAISAESSRAKTLITLGVHLLPSQQRSILVEALQTVHTITNESSRAQLLIALVRHLPSDLLDKALHVALDFSNRLEHAKSLTAIIIAKQKQHTQIQTSLDICHLEESSSHSLVTNFQPFTAEDIFLLLTPYFSFDNLNNELQQGSFSSERLPAYLTSVLQTVQSIIEKRNFAHEVIRYEEEKKVMILLVALAPCFSPDQLQVTYQIIRSITAEETRVQLLIGLIPYLPKDLLRQVLYDTNEINHEEDRAKVLQVLVPFLPPNLTQIALQNTNSISYEKYRGQTLVVLAPHLSHDLFSVALHIARSITSMETRVQALTALAPHLIPTDCTSVITEVFQTIRSINDIPNYIETITEIASFLPTDKHAYMLVTTFQVAQSIPYKQARVDALLYIVPLLPPLERPIIIIEIIQAIPSKMGISYRAQLINRLAPLLSSKLFSEALKAIKSIPDDDERARALSVIAPHIPSDRFSEALQVVCSLSYEKSRMQALEWLAPYIPPEFFKTALNLAYSLTEDWYQIQALEVLVIKFLSHNHNVYQTEIFNIIKSLNNVVYEILMQAVIASQLPLDERISILTKLLQDTYYLIHDWQRATILIALAPQLSPNLITQGVQLAQGITTEIFRTKALIALAPYISPSEHSILIEILLTTQAITNVGLTQNAS